MSIKKNISFIFGSQIINTIIGFVSSIFITRILGSEGRGDNTIFTNAIAFSVLFFGFSINSTIVYFVNSNKVKAGELLSTIILLICSSAVLVYYTLNLLEHFNVLRIALPQDIQSKPYKFIFSAIYLTSVLNGVLLAFLSTYKKFKAISVYGTALQLFPTMIYCLMFFNLIPYNHHDPFRSVVVVTFLVAIASSVAIIILFKKLLYVRPARKLMPASLIRQFVFFSSMAYAGNIATFFNYKLDFWVVDFYRGKAELGVYSLAAQLSQLLWLLPQSIATVLYTYASSSEQKQAIDYTIKLKQVSFYATLIFALLGLCLAYFFIPVLYGNEFAPAFYLMCIFITGIVPFSITTVLASLFAARGNFKVNFAVSLITFAISCSMYFTLIPRFGMVGGAVSSAIAYLSATIIIEVWFCRKYKVSLLNLFNPDKSIFSPEILRRFY
ncbi:MAG TPA: oligosaccharide flippase family protein [Chitinophagaceae bacterium]|nr:oligosaccharide flippase family protein [Chitinophagaceae bacterium]